MSLNTVVRIVPASALLALAAAALPALAQQQIYQVVLNGPSESPPVVSNGLGVAIVTFDLGASTMRLQTTFAGLTGNVTMAHIHCCTAAPGTGTAGVATTTPTFPNFPLGTTFGSYDQLFNMTQPGSFNQAYITANGGTPATAFSALVAGVGTGRAYLNIHTTFAPSGEIRGFLAPVPEPAGYALMLGGLAAVGFVARRRRQG